MRVHALTMTTHLLTGQVIMMVNMSGDDADDALVELINTRYEPMGVDLLTGPAADGWLRGHGAISRPAAAPALERLRLLREALRQLALANNGVQTDADVLARGQAAVARIPFLVLLGSAEQPPRLVAHAPDEPHDGGRSSDVDSSGDGAEVLAAQIVAEFLVRRSSPRWRQLKACPAPGCGYAFVDRSRNGSRRWCLMATCGNRAKNKAWRARQVAEDAAGSL